MESLKLFVQALIQFAKQIASLPQTLANARYQRRQQSLLEEQEAERLDRIRNPSKYLGKE